MDVDQILLLTAIAFAAGFVDAIAGGGGLITLPALLLAGIPPVSAIATNKVQAAAATISAAVTFSRKGLIKWQTGRWLAATSVTGGAVGALLVHQLDQTWLQGGVPIALVFVGMYFALAPKPLPDNHNQRLTVEKFAFTIAPLLGAYDGFFGPGVGSFFMMGFIAICGLGFVEAMGFTKLSNASSNIGAVCVFVVSGAVIWPLALMMALAAFAGAQGGARIAVRVGPTLIKPMIVLVCIALAAKLLSDASNPWHRILSIVLKF
ncbi:TSUP family transporter [Hydrogenophaga sp.]|uniref:TSUP family transporter n=1 Tax=Hydrogenophaga sp. TaxID=1904254 RepID=UPI0035ADD7A6